MPTMHLIDSSYSITQIYLPRGSLRIVARASVALYTCQGLSKNSGDESIGSKSSGKRLRMYKASIMVSSIHSNFVERQVRFGQSRSLLTIPQKISFIFCPV